ncbi:MAG: alpha/beta hydrolase [Steroidobacteraceae bacterium]
MAYQPPLPQPVVIEGPSGVLQGIVEAPLTPSAIAVICHPHPLHGGTMTNKVAHALARSCSECGMASVRFNYRGVGESAGSYDNGVGETDDALATVRWAQARWPGLAVNLAGFSFGGGVALRAALQIDCASLITVAPAVARDAPPTTLPTCPWLLVQGDADDVVPADTVLAWVNALATKPEVKVLAGAGHFFHGRLIELRELVRDWRLAQA